MPVDAGRRWSRHAARRRRAAPSGGRRSRDALVAAGHVADRARRSTAAWRRAARPSCRAAARRSPRSSRSFAPRGGIASLAHPGADAARRRDPAVRRRRACRRSRCGTATTTTAADGALRRASPRGSACGCPAGSDFHGDDSHRRLPRSARSTLPAGGVRRLEARAGRWPAADRPDDAADAGRSSSTGVVKRLPAACVRCASQSLASRRASASPSSGSMPAAAEVLVNLVTGASCPTRGVVRVLGRTTPTSPTATTGCLARPLRDRERARGAARGATLAQNLAMPFTLQIDPVDPATARAWRRSRRLRACGGGDAGAELPAAGRRDFTRTPGADAPGAGDRARPGAARPRASDRRPAGRRCGLRRGHRARHRGAPAGDAGFTRIRRSRSKSRTAR